MRKSFPNAVGEHHHVKMRMRRREQIQHVVHATSPCVSCDLQRCHVVIDFLRVPGIRTQRGNDRLVFIVCDHDFARFRTDRRCKRGKASSSAQLQHALVFQIEGMRIYGIS